MRTMRHSLLYAATVGFAILVTLVTGCGPRHPASTASPEQPTASVTVRPVESLKRTATEEVVGTVRPTLSATLTAKVSGTVKQMLAVPGQAVKAGQLLVVIDAAEMAARLDQAQAVREQARKDLERFRALVKETAVSQQEFEVVQSRARIAEAAVSEARTMLGYTEVNAPFDGIITAKHADMGDLASPGKPLLELEDPSALRLEADVPEALIDQIKLGDHLQVRVQAAGPAAEGVVSEVSPAGDPSSRTSRVKVDLPRGAKLRSGQFGRLSVSVAEVSAIRVPTLAVVVRGQMELAFVVSNGRAQLRLVKTGKRLGDEVEIVSGLSVGESLVIEGATGLLDGQRVEARR